MEITREQFEAQWRPRFGSTNPERISLAFWEWMIRGEERAGSNREPDPATQETEDENGRGYSPTYARSLFNVSYTDGYAPIWTFERLGATRMVLPDGRLVYMGGEHEDY